MSASHTVPSSSIELKREAATIRAEAKALGKKLPALKSPDAWADDLVIVPERLDTPTTRDLHEAATEYLKMREAVLRAAETPEQPVYALVRTQLAEYVDDLRKRGLIPDKLAEKGKTEKPTLGIARHLETRARSAAGEIELPKETVIASRLSATSPS